MNASARAVALDALVRSGGAAERLDAAIADSTLDARDRAFATELAYGTLKMRRALEWSLARCVTRSLDRADEHTRWALMLGAYQLLYLDRVPAHSAVDESVTLARARGGKSAAGFVNAVLRRVAREQPRPPRPTPQDGVDALGLYASLPDWIAAHLVDRFGFSTAVAAAEGMNGPPKRALRLRGTEAERAAIVTTLISAGVSLAPSRFGIPECVVILKASATPAIRDAVARGDAVWQSEESQLAVHLLDPRPGEIVLDVCAGRGVKTGMIAGRLMDGRSKDRPLHLGSPLWCVEDDRKKVVALTAVASGAAAGMVHVVETDARAPYPMEVPAQFDAAIVDAPCSGLGVIGRRADARFRKQPTDPARFSAVQKAILARTAQRVRVGGRLLYVTCSTHPVEDEGVAEAFLATHPGWNAVALPAMTADHIIPCGEARLTVPGIDGSDGFFYAMFEHRRSAPAPDEARIV